jgi:hypothetical protein
MSKPIISYGVRKQYLGVEVVGITSMTKAYYHGRRDSDARTSGALHELMALFSQKEAAEHLASAVRRIDEQMTPRYQAIERLRQEVLKDTKGLTKAAVLETKNKFPETKN